VRRPVFWFLWPAGEVTPVDAAAVQARWIRVCGRGPWRWAFLTACTAAVVTLSSAALAVALTRPGWLSVLLTTIVVVPLVALLARAWVAGTYVSDRGIKVSRILATEAVPWSVVAGVVDSPDSRLLGTPLRVPGLGVVILDDAGRGIRTHVESASPDLWLRPQARAAAADRLRTWHRETRG